MRRWIDRSRAKLGEAVSLVRTQGWPGAQEVARRAVGWLVSPLAVTIGRAIERRGGRMKVHGVRVCVGEHGISTKVKGLLALGLGGYEDEETRLVRRWLPRGQPVIELGAGIGVVAGTTNRLLADPGRHVVVEANPALLPLLEESRQANGCGYRLRHLAVAYGGPSVELSLGTTFQASSVAGRSGDAARTVTVPACTVADVAREAAFEHFSLICDIEGEEYELFEREGDLLRDRVGFLIVELHDRPHGREQIERGEARLLALGFERVAGSGKCRAYVNRALVST